MVFYKIIVIHVCRSGKFVKFASFKREFEDRGESKQTTETAKQIKKLKSFYYQDKGSCCGEETIIMKK